MSVQFPEEVRLSAERHAGQFDRKLLSKAAAELSERYREEKADGSVIAGSDIQAAAYSVVRMPATFAAVSRALELSLACYGGELHSCADVGAGTGAAALAAMQLTDETELLHCYERADAMRKLGSELVPAAQWYSADITKAPLPRCYDLVMAGYVLNELTDAQREAAILSLWSRTDGMLLITEPGTMKGYRCILQARELLMKNGALIAAPCPSVTSCPLPENDWCHFTARAARSKLHKQLKDGDVPYEDEKFSFIAAVRSDASACERRILRHPEISGGMIGLHVCTADGITDIKVTRSSKQFKAARKAACGDSL